MVPFNFIEGKLDLDIYFQHPIALE